MALGFTASSGGINLPEGLHHTRFIRIDEEAEPNQFGNMQYRLTFKVDQGPHDGSEVAMWVNRDATGPKSKQYEVATAIKGGEITTGEYFQFPDHYGVAGQVLVVKTESGSKKIDKFIRDQEQPSGEKQF